MLIRANGTARIVWMIGCSGTAPVMLNRYDKQDPDRVWVSTRGQRSKWSKNEGAVSVDRLFEDRKEALRAWRVSEFNWRLARKAT